MKSFSFQYIDSHENTMSDTILLQIHIVDILFYGIVYTSELAKIGRTLQKCWAKLRLLIVPAFCETSWELSEKKVEKKWEKVFDEFAYIEVTVAYMMTKRIAFARSNSLCNENCKKYGDLLSKQNSH